MRTKTAAAGCYPTTARDIKPATAKVDEPEPPFKSTRTRPRPRSLRDLQREGLLGIYLEIGGRR